MKSVAFLSLLAVSGVASAQIVVESNAPGGDAIVGTNPAVPTPVGVTGWVYTNVRVDGAVGINSTLPRSGNGSVSMSTDSGNGKADLEYYAGGLAAPASMGRLADITEAGYDWYRQGTSTNTALQTVSMRLLVDADGDFATSNDRGYLVYEPYYTRGNVADWPAETDTWVSEDATTGNFWQRRFNPGTAVTSYDVSLAEWAGGTVPAGALDLSQGAVVYGLSLGVGSGWGGQFDGAFDNVRIGFNGQTTTYNFETAPVPEPASMAVLGLGLAALRRRRNAKK